MPTKRHKIRPTRRLDLAIPDWAAQLLEGILPEPGTPAHHAFIAWCWLSVDVPGLPLPRSREAIALAVRVLR